MISSTEVIASSWLYKQELVKLVENCKIKLEYVFTVAYFLYKSMDPKI